MRILSFVALAGVASLTVSAGADITALNGAALGQSEGAPTQFGSIYGQVPQSPVDGDTYDARALLQDGVNAFFIDDAPDNHGFGGSEDAGTNFVGNAGDRFSIASLHTVLGGGTELVQVEMTNLSANGAPSAWQPTAGLLSPNDLVFNSWRFDMGSTAAGTDAIAWSNDFAIINSGFTAFDSTGASLGTFALTLDTSTANSMSGVAVLGLGGADIGGFDMVSIQLFWEIEKVPAPGSMALLGMVGLASMRRRR
jgi:hypothetical protein